jgi:hypothetical protein
MNRMYMKKMVWRRNNGLDSRADGFGFPQNAKVRILMPHDTKDGRFFMIIRRTLRFLKEKLMKALRLFH